MSIPRFQEHGRALGIGRPGHAPGRAPGICGAEVRVRDHRAVVHGDDIGGDVERSKRDLGDVLSRTHRGAARVGVAVAARATEVQVERAEGAVGRNLPAETCNHPASSRTAP